jgi:hypothetical protein
MVLLAQLLSFNVDTIMEITQEIFFFQHFLQEAKQQGKAN